MIYPLKLQHNENRKVFFFSDMHYNHNPNWEIPLWKRRGFNSVEEHNQTLIERWNNKVDNNSVCFHLGDIVFGKNGLDTIKYLLDKLNFGELFLMAGNHFAGYRQLWEETFRVCEIDKYYRLTYSIGNKLVHMIPNYYEIYVNGQATVLSHYPIRCHNGYASQGQSIMLHGHCHGSFKDGLPDTLTGGKILDLGPESVNEPLNFNEVMDIMNKKSILLESHHTSSTQTPFQ